MDELPAAERIATLSKVKLLESRLFDDQGHLRHEIGEKRALELLSDINVLRHKLGWLKMDLEHNLVWPDG